MSIKKLSALMLLISSGALAAGSGSGSGDVLKDDLPKLKLDHPKKNEVGEIYRVKVDKPRPTQSGVGFTEVKRRAADIKDLGEKELRKYLMKHAGEVVFGPPKKGSTEPTLWLVNGHHEAVALTRLSTGKIRPTELEAENFGEMAVTLVADWHGLSWPKFFKRMKENGYMYLENANGEPMLPSQLPKKFSDLKNDDYRSFVWELVHKDIIRKSKTPFFEFFWANFFRHRIPREELIHNPEGAAKKASEIIDKSPILTRLSGRRNLPMAKFVKCLGMVR